MSFPFARAFPHPNTRFVSHPLTSGLALSYPAPEVALGNPIFWRVHQTGSLHRTVCYRPLTERSQVRLTHADFALSSLRFGKRRFVRLSSPRCCKGVQTRVPGRRFIPSSFHRDACHFLVPSLRSVHLRCWVLVVHGYGITPQIPLRFHPARVWSGYSWAVPTRYGFQRTAPQLCRFCSTAFLIFFHSFAGSAPSSGGSESGQGNAPGRVCFTWMWRWGF